MSSISASQHYDIAIIGAGPVGICFACSLANSGLRVALIERQSEAQLAEPAFDGRDIALTHFSVGILHALDIWPRIPESEVSLLKEAQVMDGGSSYFMRFEAPSSNAHGLGYLVPNHLIRKAAFATAKLLPHIHWFTEKQVVNISSYADGMTINFSNAQAVTASLVVAADSRFSEARRQIGISASMQDFGKTMITCRMALEQSHNSIACEWFGYGQTIATLPLTNHCASVVVTLPSLQAEKLLRLSTEEFTENIENRLNKRFGKMQLVTKRYACPLVAVYANRFVLERFALLGDAAVGMHPVTAHGFNFGLRGVDSLSGKINTALAHHKKFYDLAVLKEYEKEYKRTTRPLYVATNAIVKLYTNDSAPAKILRKVGLHVGNRLVPFKKLLIKNLTKSY
ncbi:MAG: Ubiquinone biosynthesis hydroxylase, UbiH/UbiF/VisC/COQ6 family [Gammaproteobacteria bacterium]|jgi:ubiquinone biosynthesis UbiH/UbiF/VisC/COQ6 family hydroxylase|nr:Ubiquinone biosynthesis hydroxylase, UbiH/UbiF/VisC/COQ6 family [Gammaproteobacteria bacterium]